MPGIGILDDDTIIADRSVEARDNLHSDQAPRWHKLSAVNRGWLNFVCHKANLMLPAFADFSHTACDRNTESAVIVL